MAEKFGLQEGVKDHFPEKQIGGDRELMFFDLASSVFQRTAHRRLLAKRQMAHSEVPHTVEKRMQSKRY